MSQWRMRCNLDPQQTECLLLPELVGCFIVKPAHVWNLGHAYLRNGFVTEACKDTLVAVFCTIPSESACFGWRVSFGMNSGDQM
jgi:hypothetical protein